MAAPAVVVVSNSRLSGTDAKPLKNVTFSEDLSDPGVHHTPQTFASLCGRGPLSTLPLLQRRARSAFENLHSTQKNTSETVLVP